eukprot:c16655_g1_i3.p1 GENE.c16655_g1_i3~~c16655_g1_i3.p1  ORF type:complete len:351 (+),score=81.05 c16655_g1_i3:234-1286(+)
MACHVAPGPSPDLRLGQTALHGTMGSAEQNSLESCPASVAADVSVAASSAALVTAAVVHAVASQLLEDGQIAVSPAVPPRVTPSLTPDETEPAEREADDENDADALDAPGEEADENAAGADGECAAAECGGSCGGDCGESQGADAAHTATGGKKVRKPNPHHKKGKPPVQYDMFEVANAKAPEVAALIGQVEAMAMAVFGEQRFIAQVGHSAWRLHVVVEREARTLLGFVLFEHRRKKNCVSVAKVAVSDVLRGYGVGRKLMKIPKHYAKEVGAEVINLWAYFAAVGFYKHLGFRACKAMVEAADGESGADAAAVAAEVSSCWMRDDVAQYMELVVAVPDKRKRGGKKKK